MEERNRRERERVKALRRAAIMLEKTLPDGDPTYGHLSYRKIYHLAIRYIKTLKEAIANMDLCHSVLASPQISWGPDEKETYYAETRKLNQWKLDQTAQFILAERIQYGKRKDSKPPKKPPRKKKLEHKN